MKHFATAAILALALSIPGGALADHVAGDAKTIAEILAREDQLSAALAASDIEKLRQIWTEDFVSTMTDGNVTTAAKRLDALARKAAVAKTKLTNQNDKVDVRPFGDFAVALVTSTWRQDGTAVGAPYQATHVWVKRQHNWRLLAAHISEVMP